MAPKTPSTALADFLEAHRSEITAAVCSQAKLIDPAALPALIERWTEDLIQGLRGAANPAYEWTVAFVNAVRSQGGLIHEILTTLRGIRDLMIQFCSGQVEGVSEADLARFALQLEDRYLAQIGPVYSEMERRIASSERRRQRAIAAWMDRALVMLDSDGIVTLINPAFAQCVGIAEDRLLNQDLLGFCESGTATEIRRALRQKRATAARTFDGALLSQKGARIPLRFWALPMFDEEGLRNGLAMAMTPILPDGQARDARAPANAEALRMTVLQDLAGVLGIGCYTIDDTFRVVSANEQALPFVTLGVEDTGAHCCRRNLGRNGECGDCLRKRVFKTGQPYRATVQYKLPLGEIRWVEVTAVPALGDPDGIKHVMKLVRDVTEQRMLEEQFVQQQRTSLVSQLAITVAHQLRNPLSVMLGFAEMMSRGLPVDQAPVALDRIVRSGIRCKEIIQNLLEFGRGAPGEQTPVDLNAIVEERVKPAYPGSVLSRIAWRMADSLPPVEGAAEQLAQVFLNLIENALRFAKNRVVFETFARDGAVYVKVWDDGGAVAEADRARIFEPFFTTRKDEGGIGLGLSLSRSVIQEHRGVLYLDETVTVGTCFVIQLPATEPAGGIEPRAATPEPVRRAGRRILVVEDETDLSFLLTMALHAEGFEVDTAVTGAQAIELIQQTAYDALVVDMLLADELGGREIYQILQQMHPALLDRLLFITGDTMKYETRRFLSGVQRPFMEKPFMISDFSAKIEEILAKKPGT